MRRIPTLIVLIALGCPPAAQDTASAPDTDSDDPPEDVDADGWDVDEDCDDRDPYAYPGNTESWDGRDNDCDGFVDGEGAFAGDHMVSATAIYEGTPVSFSLTCPTDLTRYPGTLAFTIACSPDPEDAQAMLLLGESVTIEPIDNGASGEAWEGSVEVTSSNGWSADGHGSASWVTMDHVVLTTELDAVSLDLAGDGLLDRPDE